MDKRDIWYSAGIIDGEGCIGISKTMLTASKYKTIPYHYIPYVKVASVDERLIDYLMSIWPGWKSKRGSVQKTNHKASWMWELKNWPRVSGFLKIIFPYLKIKDRQAKVLIDFIDWRIQRRIDKKRKLFRYTPEEVEKMDQFYWRIRKLNFRGIPPATTE